MTIDGQRMIKRNFAQALVEARKKAGKSQEQLSSDSNINNRYLQRLEAGESDPTLTTLFKLAWGCGTTPEKLIMSAWKSWGKKGGPHS